MTGPPLRSGSLCSGYLGLDLVISALTGCELAWCADNDKGAAAIIAHRAPGTPNMGDITAMAWEDLEQVDVLAAGFPCQPASGAGKRKGIHDERWIWPDIAAGIGRMVAPPRLLVLENVDRLLSVSDGKAMAQVVCSLAALGYVGRYGLYRACDAGAPHRRERLFILGWHAGAQDPDRAAVIQRRLAGPGETAGGRSRAHPGRPGVLGADAAADAAGPRRARGENPGTNQDDAGTPAEAGGRRPAWRLELERGGFDIDWKQYGPAIARWERLRGIAAPCPVEPGKNGQRQLAAPFAEWMMGLPPGWVTGVPGLSRSAQLKAIGNGVVPQQVLMAVTSLLSPLAVRAVTG